MHRPSGRGPSRLPCRAGVAIRWCGVLPGARARTNGFGGKTNAPMAWLDRPAELRRERISTRSPGHWPVVCAASVRGCGGGVMRRDRGMEA